MQVNDADAVAGYFALIGLRSDVLLRVKKEKERKNVLWMSRYVCCFFFRSPSLSVVAREETFTLSPFVGQSSSPKVSFSPFAYSLRVSHWHSISSARPGPRARNESHFLKQVASSSGKHSSFRSINATLSSFLFQGATSSHLSI